ncbi:hypothetical protein O988_07938, partial [Pseudogymnoascus sp. VKM F-3808]
HDESFPELPCHPRRCAHHLPVSVLALVNLDILVSIY